MTTTVYISIGNSDDKLSQHDWACFLDDVYTAVSMCDEMHGSWYSSPIDPWQNACWCVVWTNDLARDFVKAELARLATKYKQNSIIWAEARVEFINGERDGTQPTSETSEGESNGTASG